VIPSDTVLAIDVGGTSIKAAVITADGQVLRTLLRPTPVATGGQQVVQAILAACAELTDGSVRAVGLVVPGLVDVAAGVARFAANIDWHDVPLRDLLTTATGLPVTLEHDVRAAGFAEQVLGGFGTVSDSLLVVLGTGIAAVVLADGRPIRGATDSAGELGHLSVYPEGEPCSCGGRGCVEVYASGGGIARRYQRAIGGQQQPSKTALQVITDREFDPVAAQVWGTAVTALGLGLAAATSLIDPELIILGGGLGQAGEVLAVPVAAAIAGRLPWRQPPRVLCSRLGPDGGRWGAALFALNSLGVHSFQDWRVGQ